MAKKQHLNHYTSSCKALCNKMKYWGYRGYRTLSLSPTTTCLIVWVWSYSFLNPSLFLLIYGLTMGTGSVPNPAQFPPLVLTFPDLLSPLICLHKEDRIILSLSFPPLTWSHGHGSFGTLPLLTIHGNRGCC